MNSKKEIITRKNAIAIGAPRYFSGSICYRGHISERWTMSGKCISCHYESNPKKKIERISPKEKIEMQKARGKKWYENNKEKTIAAAKEWKLNNSSKVRESERRWRKKAKSKAICFMRDSLRRTLKIEKNGRTEEILGYTRAELKEHIEKQFVSGMTWDNHGVWHIDHITPISVLLDGGETDPSVINALPNLMPVFASENLRKNNKVEVLI